MYEDVLNVAKTATSPTEKLWLEWKALTNALGDCANIVQNRFSEDHAITPEQLTEWMTLTNRLQSVLKAKQADILAHVKAEGLTQPHPDPFTPEDYVAVPVSKFRHLLKQDHLVDLLEAGGVDNWDWYEDSVHHPTSMDSISQFQEKLETGDLDTEAAVIIN